MTDHREATEKARPASSLRVTGGSFSTHATSLGSESEERGQDTDFEGSQDWTQLGSRIQVLSPGRRGLSHRESGQEDFLVVTGECVLVIGEERGLRTWDFVHCPPWTHHVFVGAGRGPCVIVMTGSRAGGFDVVYPVNERRPSTARAARRDIETRRSPRQLQARRTLGIPRGLAPVTSQSPGPVVAKDA